LELTNAQRHVFLVLHDIAYCEYKSTYINRLTLIELFYLTI
jgi:hypothetical protein